MPESPPRIDTQPMLIAGSISVDLTRMLPGAGGGLPAFAANDRKNPQRTLMALPVATDAPARATAIASLAATAIPGILSPVACGPGPGPNGGAALYVVVQAPPGPALVGRGGEATRPWSEVELLACVMRPVALALEALLSRGLTHRAINPENLFRAGPGEPVVLGAAWAAPSASLQRALYEPPYAAMCLPNARGEGTIADDVYALGVTLLVLALGAEPLAGLDDAEIIRRKLEFGSFQALVGEARLPPAIGDLVRGLLAEDPEHRPPPSLLSDPVAARARRVASRPPRRAQRPLQIGAATVWNARTLAHALAVEPDQALRALRAGQVDQWLRRGLGEPVLAGKIDEFVRLYAADSPNDARADATLLMRLTALLDPLAPLCWRGIAVWPDGLGAASAGSAAAAHLSGGGRPAGGGLPLPDVAGRLAEIISTEAPSDWSNLRTGRCDTTRARAEARHMGGMLRQRGWSGGMVRLSYAFNSLLPCRSNLLAGQVVVRANDLLPALNRVAAAEKDRRGLPIDREITAFLLGRQERRLESEVSELNDAADPDQAATGTLRLYASLQAKLSCGPLPHLAAWLVQLVQASKSQRWKSRRRGAEMEQAMTRIVGAGDLSAVLALFDDPVARATDDREALAAADAIRQIDQELAGISIGGPARAESARRLGGEIAASVGLTALALAGVVAAFAP